MKLYGLTAIPTEGFTVSKTTDGLPVSGNIVNVTVIESQKNALLLEMSNGVILEARCENGELTVSKGDRLLMHVHDIKDGILYARIFNTDKTDKEKPSYIDKANETLTRLNLQKSDINVRIASELIKSGIEVTKDTLRSLAEVYSRYGHEGIKASVLLLSGGGTLDNQNIENLIHVHKGVLKLDGLIESMEESIENMLETGGNDDLQNLVSEFKRVFSRPEELGFSLPRIKEIYEEIINLISLLKTNSSKNSGGEKATATVLAQDKLASSVESLERAVRFLMDVSEYIPYFQIPVRLEDSYTTGEIFIMRRRKSLKTGATFTVLLSLTTRYMGSIDALIEFYGRNIRLHFRVDKNTIRDFVNGCKKRIAEQLEALNYIVTDIKCETGTKISLLDAPVFLSARSERSTGIDYRV